MSDEELLFERRGAVAWVTLNRPEVRNALTPDMRNRLIEVVEEVVADLELRCLVITGAGEGFCTGADIRGASSRQGSGSGERTAGAARDVIVNGVQRLFRALWNLEVPTIAAVNGTAAGFGCHLAWMCDLVIASDNARFIEAFTRRGIVLFQTRVPLEHHATRAERLDGPRDVVDPPAEHRERLWREGLHPRDPQRDPRAVEDQREVLVGHEPQPDRFLVEGARPHWIGGGDERDR